jgi:hypothetical protein
MPVHFLFATKQLLCMTSFPMGRCCRGDSCIVPQHELRKHCPGCNGLIHALCGHVLVEDEGGFTADSVVCLPCDQKSQPKSNLSLGMQSWKQNPECISAGMMVGQRVKQRKTAQLW